MSNAVTTINYQNNHQIEVFIISASWNATTLFDSTSHVMPKKISKLFQDINLIDKTIIDFSKHNIDLVKENVTIEKNNIKAKKEFLTIYKNTANHNETPLETIKTLENLTNTFHKTIYDQVEQAINKDAIIGLLGGDSSCSYPIINALIDYIPTFSILQLNAELHLEIPNAKTPYATQSIMSKILTDKNDIKRLVQVGSKHYTEAELTTIKKYKGQIKTFFQEDILKDLYLGKPWDSYCKKIINNTTDNIYISIHANSLQPHYSSTTQSFSEASFTYDQLHYLIKQVSKSGKKIIGFDIVGIEDTDYLPDLHKMTQLLYTLSSCSWKTYQ
ncbi:hypothetical protein CL658_02030 [bacterium]|nr:hypothetical protein [bacterium]|tara:strand:- start:793 stop:1782 length:990 start_codon:yes stop_codon:yes gene_type:complete